MLTRHHLIGENMKPSQSCCWPWWRGRKHSRQFLGCRLAWVALSRNKLPYVYSLHHHGFRLGWLADRETSSECRHGDLLLANHGIISTELTCLNRHGCGFTRLWGSRSKIDLEICFSLPIWLEEYYILLKLICQYLLHSRISCVRSCIVVHSMSWLVTISLTVLTVKLTVAGVWLPSAQPWWALGHRIQICTIQFNHCLHRKMMLMRTCHLPRI